jgi:hypothetical protein
MIGLLQCKDAIGIQNLLTFRLLILARRPYMATRTWHLIRFSS